MAPLDLRQWHRRGILEDWRHAVYIQADYRAPSQATIFSNDALDLRSWAGSLITAGWDSSKAP